MTGSKVLRFVFFMLMGVITAMLFYQIFFQIKIDGHEGGVLVYLSRQAEVPMAQYYYKYSYVPNTVSTFDIDYWLGYNCYSPTSIGTDIYTKNYEGTRDVFVIIPSSSGIYSTGWTDKDDWF